MESDNSLIVSKLFSANESETQNCTEQLNWRQLMESDNSPIASKLFSAIKKETQNCTEKPVERQLIDDVRRLFAVCVEFFSSY